MLPNGPYESKNIEKDILREWLESGAYKPEYNPKEGRVVGFEEMILDTTPTWALICPPPNAYGRPHIGNISGYAYMDAMARYQRMNGKKVLVLPGKDHAGLEGEGVFVREVLEKQGRRKFEMKREDFYSEMMDWMHANMQDALKDEQEIGLSADFDRNTFTLDPNVVDTVLDTFIEMYNDKKIYKGVRIVNWDPKARTAVADNQIEYIESQTPFFYFKYNLINQDRRIWNLSFYKKEILNQILEGTKTVETRALNPEEPDRYFGDIKAGDIINCTDRTTGTVHTFEAKDVRIYKDLEVFLVKEDFSKIKSNWSKFNSAQELIDAYDREVADEYGQKIKNNGVVAIELKKFEGDPDPKAIELKNKYSKEFIKFKAIRNTSEDGEAKLPYTHGLLDNEVEILGIGYTDEDLGKEVTGLVTAIRMSIDEKYKLLVVKDYWKDYLSEGVSIEEIIKFENTNNIGAHFIAFDEFSNNKFYTNGFVIGTVRPETIFADTAIACDPKDSRYKRFVGKKVKVEFLGQVKELSFIEDFAVDKDFGTGLLKVTPAHAVEDWEIANRHPKECLPAIQVIGYDLKMNYLTGKYAGLKLTEARTQMREDMKAFGNLVYVDDSYANKIAIAERTKAPIEPLLSSQWYLKYDGIKEATIDMVASGEVKLHPESMSNKFNHWMNNLRDWAISRSLWWGYRLPVWYHGRVKEEIGTDGMVRELINLTEGEVSDSSLPEGVKIRKAQIEDAERMFEIDIQGWYQNFIDEERGITKEVLMTKYGRDLNNLEMLESFRKHINDSNEATYVAEKEGRVVGWANVENLNGNGINWLNVYVDEENQRSGIGSMLMKKAIYDNGHLEIHISTPQKANLKGFYEKFGFVEYPVEGRKEGGLYTIQMKRKSDKWVPLEYDNPNHLRVQKESPGKDWLQDESVLDTWFSSGQWVYATLEKYKLMDKFFPTDVMVSGFDILENWISRMMMFTYFKHKDIPFKNVYLTGLVKGTDGQKMSKSKGNVLSIDDLREKYGTDAVRMVYFYQNSAGADYAMTYEKLDTFKKFINKIWNASKFVLMNLDGVDIEGEQTFVRLQSESLTLQESKDLYNHVIETKAHITKNIERFELGLATYNLYQAFWYEFADKYIEQIKKYTYVQKDKETGAVISEPNPKDKLEAQKVLLFALKEYMKMLHPFIPFITQRIWNELPKAEGDNKFLMHTKW